MEIKAIIDITRQSATTLRANLLKAIAGEHQATAELLRYLAEYESRELHLRDGYSSLYSFLTQGHGYSEGAAARRCNVARFARKRGEILKWIASGDLSLSVADLVARAVGRGEVRDDQLPGLMSKVLRKSKTDAENALAEIGVTVMQPAPRERIRPVAIKLMPPAPPANSLTDSSATQANPDEVEAGTGQVHDAFQEQYEGMGGAPAVVISQEFHVSLRLSSDVMAQLKRAQQILGAPDLATTIAKVAEFHNRRKDPLRDSQGRTPPAELPKDHAAKMPPARPVEGSRQMSASRRRYIPAPVRREVFQKAGGRCSFVDRKSGRRCVERKHLEVDHVKPFACGGGNDADNLQLLCRAHNAMRGRDTFGKGFRKKRSSA